MPSQTAQSGQTAQGGQTAQLVDGIGAMARVLGRTLGPSAAPVLCAGDPVELLTDSATLARRITGLGGSGRAHHAGALLVRDLARQVRRTHGDGAATATVLADAMVRRARRLVVAGAQPVDVRRGLERGVEAACAAAARQATPAGPDELRALVVAAVPDRELADLLVEAYDLLGEHAALLVHDRDDARAARTLDHEYVDGARWTARPADDAWLPEGTSELTVREPLVVVVDDVLRDERDVVPVLDLAHREGRPVVLIARELEDAALRLLLTMRARPGSPAVAPWCLASATGRLSDDLGDLAVLTGANVLAAVVGRPPAGLAFADCGTARQASLARTQFTISGGAGDPSAAIATLDARLRTASPVRVTPGRGSGGMADQTAGQLVERLRVRLARLAGALTVITIAGGTEPERALRRENIDNARRVAESARACGVLPGGGIALLRCRSEVAAVRDASPNDDERHGVEVVLAALEEPFRRLVASHGSVDPAVAVERLDELGPGWAFDVVSGAYVRTGSGAGAAGSGPVDSAGVVIGALQAAGSLAASVVSTAGVVSGVPGGARG